MSHLFLVINFLFVFAVQAAEINNRKSDIDTYCEETHPFIEELGKNNVDCLSSNGIIKAESLSAVKDLEKISIPLQEWVWIDDKASDLLANYKKKETVLKNAETAFTAAKNHYPKGSTDEASLAVVEDYLAKYEELVEAVRDDDSLQKSLNFCYGQMGFHCHVEKIDEFKLKQEEARARKMSILQMYPLLSSEGIRESLEDETELYNRYMEGKEKNYKGLEDFHSKQRIKRREQFPDLMLKGIGKLKGIVKDKLEDIRDFKNQGNKINQQQVDIDKKTMTEKSTSLFPVDKEFYKQNRKLRGRNMQIMGEIIDNVDISEETKQRYIGQAVCSVYFRHSEQEEIEKIKDRAIDATLLIAPFFLGPVGAAARVAMMSRFASFGLKGAHFAGETAFMTSSASTGAKAMGFAAGVVGETATIYAVPGVISLQRKIDRCSQSNVAALYLKNEDFNKSSKAIEADEKCDEEIRSSLLDLFSMGAGVAVFSGVRVYKEHFDFMVTFAKEKLSPKEIEALFYKLEQLKKNEGLNNRKALEKLKKAYDEKVLPISCEIN